MDGLALLPLANTIVAWGGVVTAILAFVKLFGLAARFGGLEAEHRIMMKMVIGDAKYEVKRLGLVTAQSPERAAAHVTALFDASAFGAALRRFYVERRVKDLNEPRAIWALYEQFSEAQWEAEVMRPLDVNLSKALVLALQYCRDGEGRNA